MLVFINNIYVSPTNIEFIELLIHDESTLTNEYITLTYEDAFNKCKHYYEKGYYVEPLKSGEFIISDNPRVTRVSDGNSVKANIMKEDTISSVYELYWDLANTKSVYLDRDDRLEDGYIGLVPTFDKIRVSNSTMSVNISMFDEESSNWKTKALISQDDSSPKQQEFFCAIPKDQCDLFYKYGLSKVKRITLNNKDFVVFKYMRNLSIYRCGSNLQFPEPLVVNYMYKSLQYKTLIRILKYALNSISSDLGVNQEVYARSKDNLRKSSIFNDKSGVFFTSNFDKVTNRSIEAIYKTIENLYPALVERKIKFDIEGARGLSRNLKLPNYCDVSIYFLLDIIVSGDGKTLSTISLLSDTIASAYLNLLECDLYLYNIRTSTYINPQIVDYKVPERVFNIFSSEGSVKVEVWI